MIDTTSYCKAIDDHYSENWSAPIEVVRWTKGPLHQLPEGFRVLVFRRSPEMLAYGTRCMSEPSDAEPLELHILALPDEEYANEIVEILTVVAHYHRTGSRLGLGHTVNFGRPWVSGSNCTHGLISLPYMDGPELEWLDEPKVRFLWLIPVTESEVRFKQSNGLEALEERFEEVRFNYLDPFRRSVV
jgi:Suppressor of fused protein (SUFU)